MASKQIKISFYSDGSVNQSASEAIGIRQGDSNGAVAIIAAFAGKRNDQYVCKLNFERPDGRHIANVLMSEDESDSTAFVYSVGSSWFFAVAGNARLTVTLTDQSGAIAAQGSYSFRIEPTEVVVADSTLTYDEQAALEGMIAEIDAEAVKRANTVVLSSPTISDFYAKCDAYYSGSTIYDGDRFAATYPEGETVYYFFGEYHGPARMIVSLREVGPSIDRLSLYLVCGPSDGAIVEKIATTNYVDSFFANGMALQAIADENGNNIVLTYETKADANAKNTTLLSYFTDGKANFALADADGNGIIATYETKADSQAKDATAVHKAGAETITGSKTFNATQYFKMENQFDQKNWFNKGINVSGGNIVLGTLLSNNYIELSGAKLVSIGMFGRANYLLPHISGNGFSDVDYTFAMTDDVAAAVERSNLVSIIQEATQSLSGLMSATDKSRLDALYALLGATEDADTVVNTINEVLAIFDQYPEGASLVNALAQKVSISDVVDALTSDDPTKPLSAKQGKALKKLIDDTLADFIAEDSAFRTAEAERVTAENGRVAAENARVAAENARALAEQNRQAELDSKLSKGDYDGRTGVGYADLANNLNTKIKESDDDSYSFRSAGGSLEIGSNCKVKGIVGGSIGFNQLVKNGNFANTDNWNAVAGSASASGNVLTYELTSEVSYQDTARMTQSLGSTIKAGHRFICSMYMKYSYSSSSTGGGYSKGFYFRGNNNYVQSYLPFSAMTANAWNKVEALVVASADIDTLWLVFGMKDAEAGSTVQIKNVMITDLDADFGKTIADYIYTLETGTAGAGVAWFKRYFPKPYYPYTAIGGFINVKTSGKRIQKFNLWDEEWEVGSYDSSNGLPIVASKIRNKNPIPVMPNTTYYYHNGANLATEMFYYDAAGNFLSYGGGVAVGTFTTPARCYYINIAPATSYGMTYNHDININFHYDGERDGEYEAYDSKTYPCDDVELIGIPKIDAQGNLYYEGNVYRPDGTIKGKAHTILIDGTYAESYSGGETLSGNYRIYVGLSPYDLPYGDANWTVDTGDIFSCNYDVVTPQVNAQSTTIARHISHMNGARTIGIVVNGITTRQELLDYLDENPIRLIWLAENEVDIGTATPYQETQEVDNWGTEEYIDERDIPIPVGHETEYLADLKSKLEISPDTPTADGEYVLITSSGVNTYIPLATYLSDNGYVKKTDYQEGNITLLSTGDFALANGTMPYGKWRVQNGKLSIVFTLNLPVGNTLSSNASRRSLSDGFIIPASVAALLTDIPGATGYKALEAKTMIGTNAGLQFSGRIEAWLLVDADGYCRIDFANETLSNAYVPLYQRFEFEFIL